MTLVVGLGDEGLLKGLPFRHAAGPGPLPRWGLLTLIGIAVMAIMDACSGATSPTFGARQPSSLRSWHRAVTPPAML